jgi:hypothetical protein
MHKDTHRALTYNEKLGRNLHDHKLRTKLLTEYPYLKITSYKEIQYIIYTYIFLKRYTKWNMTIEVVKINL